MARKVFMFKNEVNTPYSSGEVNMDSVGSTKEQIKFNTPVPEPHDIAYTYSSPPFLAQVANPDSESISVNDNYGSEANNDGAKNMVQWYEGGK